MQQIHDFSSNFENIYRDGCAIDARLSYDSYETFMRVSHNIRTNVAKFYFIAR